MSDLGLRLSHVFQPSSPIEHSDLFYGRIEEVRRVVDAINQAGMHAIIYGEPGVGKTSLGKILQQKIKAINPVPVMSPLVTCTSQETYETMWQTMLEYLDEIVGRDNETYTDSHLYSEDQSFLKQREITPNEVRKRLEACPDGVLYLIFDEFNKVEDDESRRLFADTIKLLSDRQSKATIVVIGVSEDVAGLIEDHQSIERCLSQIPMPRMPRQELEQIITNGLSRVGMNAKRQAVEEISFLSKGLPHYTHLLALHAGRAAVDAARMVVDVSDVEVAIDKAIRQAQESIRIDYDYAVASARKNLYSDVLLACAMAKTDSFGRFSPSDVVAPLQTIRGEKYTTDRFAKHLTEFCERKRGAVLLRTGRKYRWKYRFRNPLMEPFVILTGRAQKVIVQDDLKQYVDATGQKHFWKP